MQTSKAPDLDRVTAWHAVHTRYQHETPVSQLLSQKGFCTFLPTYPSVRLWKDRKKILSLPLFPGYLFVGDISDRKLQVLNTPGVCEVLMAGGAPAVIDSEEIQSIRRAGDINSPIEPHPFLATGDKVKVQEGPLAGVEGFLVKVKERYQLVISVQILGRAAAVEIDASCVRQIAA